MEPTYLFNFVRQSVHVLREYQYGEFPTVQCTNTKPLHGKCRNYNSYSYLIYLTSYHENIMTIKKIEKIV